MPDRLLLAVFGLLDTNIESTSYFLLPMSVYVPSATSHIPLRPAAPIEVKITLLSFNFHLITYYPREKPIIVVLFKSLST